MFIADSRPALYAMDLATSDAKEFPMDLEPEFQDAHALEVRDGVLWYFGYKDLAFFEGTTWTRVDHPDNLPIR